MFRHAKYEGIVIKRINSGETDKLITFFTKHNGKIRVKAKGVRKIHSRKAPHLELLNHLTIFTSLGKINEVVTEVVSIDIFGKIKKDLISLAYIYKIIEIIDILCPLGEKNDEVFSLLLKTLKDFDQDGSINRNKHTKEVIVTLLEVLGYLPKGRNRDKLNLQSVLDGILEKRLKSDSLLTRI